MKLTKFAAIIVSLPLVALPLSVQAETVDSLGKKLVPLSSDATEVVEEVVVETSKEEPAISIMETEVSDELAETLEQEVQIEKETATKKIQELNEIELENVANPETETVSDIIEIETSEVEEKTSNSGGKISIISDELAEELQKNYKGQIQKMGREETQDFKEIDSKNYVAPETVPETLEIRAFIEEPVSTPSS
ncbi:hypothetical protein CY0110_01135 [Crocosphaera chwakensis CCY0110]|uniref:Uncharacterized protein n=2 Tax=Crocosphaera TaxID=263510 RepID=A3IXR7_9CHRO|nr:hypothetical protein CY0110_01135 [Crocosphaera chwakensis CCY0110]